MQIEYALNAVAAGATSLGIKVNHVLLVTQSAQQILLLALFFLNRHQDHLEETAFEQATNGVVLATEKKLRSTLIDDSTVKRISVVSPNIGLAYSGMGPDSRLLVRRARKQAQVRLMLLIATI